MTIKKSSNIIKGYDISKTLIQQGEVQNVYDYGSATSAIVNNNGTQNVYNNGSTTSTTVNNNGTQNVYNNASAYVTMVNDGGVQNIHDGGYGFYTTVNKGGYVTTTNNGISFQPYIQSNGYEDVGFNKFTQSSSVGSSVSAQLYGGSQYVYSGSIASNATVFNGGASIILGYGSAVNTSVTSGGRQEVYGNASHTTLDDTAVLNVTEGGRTFDTVVREKSAENVFKNGSAANTIVENNGAQNVYNNGSTTSTTVNNNGAQNVYENASAYVTIVNNSGAQNVFNGGNAFYTVVNQGGYLTTNSDGKSYGVIIAQGAYEDVGYNKMAGVSAAGFSYDAQIYGSQYVYSGSIVSNATVFTDGQQTLLNAGNATNLVLSGGTVNVSSGGHINNDVTFVNSGTVNVYSGAIVSTALNNHGTENIYLGGSAVNTIIDNNSLQNVSGGAIALNTKVNSGGQQILSGTSTNVASATGTTVFAGGQQTILSGGQAGEINISGGIVNISAGGTINGNVNFDTIAGGAVNVFSGASISSQITNRGAVYIYDGGKTENVTIKDGYEHVLSGGTINNTTVNNMGNIYINSGGTASGLTVNSGGNTSIFTDGVASNVDIGDQGIIVVDGGKIADTTITYGGILNVTSGSILTTTVNNGGAMLFTTNQVTYRNIILKTGSFLNNRKVLQDLTIDSNTRIDLATLFNDSTLFAPVNSNLLPTTGQDNTTSALINNQNQSISSETTDKNHTPSGTIHITNSADSNSLLKNQNYFAPLNTDQQPAVLQKQSVITPTTYSASADDLPTTDGEGNAITWNDGYSDDTQVAKEIDLRDYTVNDSDAEYSSFLPPGQTERIWNIGLLFAGASSYLPKTMGYGDVLVYNSNAVLNTNSSFSYPGNTYIVGGAKVTMDSNANISNLFIYKDSTVTATDGSIGNLQVGEGGIANIADTAKLTGTLSLDNGGKVNITTSTGNIISLMGTENNGLVISGNVAEINYNDKDHITITLNDGSSTTLNIVDIEQTGYTIGNNNDRSLQLNNPDLFVPVSSVSHTLSPKSRTFVTPTMFAATTDDYPTQDGNGDPITDVTEVTDSPEAIDLQMLSYNDKDGLPTYSIIPNGKTEADRVWGIENQSQSNNPVPSSGSWLIYGDMAIGRLNDTYTDYPIYAAEGAKLVTEGGFTKADNVYIYKDSSLSATQGSFGNLYVGEGGVANIADPAKLTGTLSLDNGGKANITTSTGGVVSLTGTENKGLVISGKAAQNGTTVASTIMDFDGHDSLTLQDIQRSDVTGVKIDGADHVTISLKDGSSITLNIIGIQQTGYTLGVGDGGALVFEACFLAGTAITTQDGIMAVETINIGDIIKIFDWKTDQTNNAVVSWVGKKHMTVKTGVPDDLAGYPVRILKDAIANNIPNQDLLVTPEHCFFFDGHFIPARMLVNGFSIYYDYTITSYNYYHIETEEHSVIWANGTLTESYLDTGNKNVFSNNQKIVSLFNKIKDWNIDAAAPLTVQREIVEPIYNQIKDRAVNNNFVSKMEEISVTNDPDLHLKTDNGTIIYPHSCNDGKYLFNIPDDIHSVHLMSRISRPCDTIGSFVDDRRYLGILVGDIYSIHQNNISKITNHLSASDQSGWDIVEQSPCRWTNGAAILNIQSEITGKRILVINVLAAGPYIEDISRNELHKIAV